MKVHKLGRFQDKLLDKLLEQLCYNSRHLDAVDGMVTGLPTYADNTAATAAGLSAGKLYRTSTGVVMVVY